MFWADGVADDVIKKYDNKIQSGKPIIIRDEKTASGRVHVGSLRGVLVHAAISRVLDQRGINNTFLYEINDFDPMDGLPASLDKKEYEDHMGKPLYMVPAPDGSSKNFAQYYGEEFMNVITGLGFTPTFIYSSDAYRDGKYNEVIKTTLDNAGVIRDIYKRVSGSDKPKEWFPVNPRCEKCGKIGTTKVNTWNGETITYTCGDFVDWAKGCGNSGEMSPFNGNAKLAWKVEWAAKFKVFDVDVEGAGKDHSTKGGSRDVANAISREVFENQPPYDVPYEWLNIEGRSMSSSKGVGVAAVDIATALPPEMLNLLLLQKKQNQAIDFNPEGDTIPNLFDTYDRMAQYYFDGDYDDYRAKIFKLIHPAGEKRKLKKRILPRFSLVAYLVQMPHINVRKEIEKLQDIRLGFRGRRELKERMKYARQWLDTFAPDKFKFEIQQTTPKEAHQFSSEQKAVLAKVLEYVQSQNKLDGEVLHSALHDIKNEAGIDPKVFFEALYMSFLGKPSGPKAGWFLSVLDKEFIEKRLEEVSK